MDDTLSEEIERIGLEYVAKEFGLSKPGMNQKILTNNFTIADLYKFKCISGLDNKKICELFGI
jgi:hypothetical protein